jgi:iron(III) transport system permease protein
MAYAFTDFLQFSGPVQSMLRELTGLRRLPWFPDIRSVGGAVIVFIFALYPYVYLLVRTSFLERSPRLHDAARTLGCSPLQAFIRVVLPLARPAAVAGVALVLMETLADYGAVAYFGVQTFTTGIYRAWLSMSDRVAAAQLASALMVFVFILLVLEKHSRGRLRFYGVGQRFRRPESRQLKGLSALIASVVCALPLLIGFILPTWIMIRLALRDVESLDFDRYFMWLTNTLKLASITSILAVGCTLLLAYAVRLAPGRLTRLGNDIASLGYAVPGAVLAVGILIPLTRLDHWMTAQGWLAGLALTGTIAGLQTVEAGLAKITPSVDASARSLGASNWELLTRVHAPLLRRSVLTAALLVFVDVMKELPATLVLRPFNMDTLAVITDQLASDERLGEAAVPALTIVLAGLIPVILLARAISRKE